MERLESQQMVLADKQEELKTNFHEELLRVEAKIEAVKGMVATPTPLRPTASPFIPTTTSSAPLEFEGGSARAEKGEEFEECPTVPI